MAQATAAAEAAVVKVYCSMVWAVAQEHWTLTAVSAGMLSGDSAAAAVTVQAVAVRTEVHLTAVMEVAPTPVPVVQATRAPVVPVTRADTLPPKPTVTRQQTTLSIAVQVAAVAEVEHDKRTVAPVEIVAVTLPVTPEEVAEAVARVAA